MMAAPVAILASFQQRLPGLGAPRRPLGDPRLDLDAHLRHGHARRHAGLLWWTGDGHVAIGGVVILGVLRGHYTSTAAIQEVRGSAGDPSVSVDVHGTQGEVRAARQRKGIPCQEGCGIHRPNTSLWTRGNKNRAGGTRSLVDWTLWEVKLSPEKRKEEAYQKIISDWKYNFSKRQRPPV